MIKVREAIDRIKWKYEKCDGCNRNQIDIETWYLAITALEAVERIREMEWHEDGDEWERGYNSCLREVKEIVGDDSERE